MVVKAVSPVVAVIVLIAVAIIGALLLGHYLAQTVRSGSSKGAILSIYDAELYQVGGGSWQKYYVLSVRVANTGTDSATITKIELWGENSYGSFINIWTKTLSKQVQAGGSYSGSWTFSAGSYSAPQVGKTYVVIVTYKDQWGTEKSVSINVKCEKA